jgi:hypothetical protein
VQTTTGEDTDTHGHVGINKVAPAYDDPSLFCDKYPLALIGPLSLLTSADISTILSQSGPLSRRAERRHDKDTFGLHSVNQKVHRDRLKCTKGRVGGGGGSYSPARYARIIHSGWNRMPRRCQPSTDRVHA